MIKIIGAFLLIISGFSAGMMMAQGLKKKVLFYEDLLSFLSELKSLISYTSQPLSDVFGENTFNGVFNEFSNAVHLSMQCENTFEDAWKKSLSILSDGVPLEDDDISLISEFGRGLGKTDISGQIALCELISAKADSRLQMCRKDKESKSQMYKTLGVLGGAATALLII